MNTTPDPTVEAVLAALSGRLTISVDRGYGDDYYNPQSMTLHVKLSLDGKEISCGSVSFTEGSTRSEY